MSDYDRLTKRELRERVDELLEVERRYVAEIERLRATQPTAR